MSSSPALQPQRGAGDKSVVNELADETVVDDEAIACDVVTPDDDVDKSCDVQLLGDMVESFCNVEIIVDVRSSSDSGSTGISEKSRLGNRREFRPENRREFSLVDRVSGSLLFPAGAGASFRTFRMPTDALTKDKSVDPSVRTRN